MGKQETKDKIRGARDLKSEKIHILEWDVDIEVRALSAKARAKILQRAADDKGKIDTMIFQWVLLVESCFDVETGEKLFTDDDQLWMMEKSFAPVERIGAIAIALSGLSKAREEVLVKKLQFGHPERKFYFILAEKLGMTVEELLDRMSSEELTEWIGFYKLRQIEQEQERKRQEMAHRSVKTQPKVFRRK